jgi:DnaJ-class molecular chaperone
MLLMLSLSCTNTIFAEEENGEIQINLNLNSTWNYYERLNISNDAMFSIIKQSYRKYIVFLHPDKLLYKNITEEMKDLRAQQFLLIQEAYEALSNPMKRLQYDEELVSGFTSTSSFSDKNRHWNDHEDSLSGKSIFSDSIFSMFVNSKSKLKMSLKMNFPPVDIPDVIIPLGVSLQSYFDGGEHNTSYKRRTRCSFCLGNGSENGQSIRTCDICAGSGYNAKKFIKNQFHQIIYSKCEECTGKGFIIIKKCPYCGGIGFVYEEGWFLAHIPCGFHPYQSYLYKGLGHESNNGRFGDLQVELRYDLPSGFTIEERPNKNESHNIIYYYNTTIQELQQGNQSFPLTYLDGQELEVTIPAGITVEDILNGFEIRKEKLGLYRNFTVEEIEKEPELSTITTHFDTNHKKNDKLCNLDRRGDLILKLNIDWKDIHAEQIIDSMIVRVFLFPIS